VRFGSEDLRAVALSLFIQGGREGGRDDRRRSRHDAGGPTRCVGELRGRVFISAECAVASSKVGTGENIEGPLNPGPIRMALGNFELFHPVVRKNKIRRYAASFARPYS
jgi:hypothetical protein